MVGSAFQEFDPQTYNEWVIKADKGRVKIKRTWQNGGGPKKLDQDLTLSVKLGTPTWPASHKPKANSKIMVSQIISLHAIDACQGDFRVPFIRPNVAPTMKAMKTLSMKKKTMNKDAQMMKAMNVAPMKVMKTMKTMKK